MSEKYWFLKRCDLFERLTAEQLTRVESRARICEFSKGSPVYLPADQADDKQARPLDKGRIVPVVINKAFAHSLWGLPAGIGARTVSGAKGESSHAA